MCALNSSWAFLFSTVVQQLQTEVGQQVPPVSKAVTSFFDPLKSLPQTPVSETPTGKYCSWCNFTYEGAGLCIYLGTDWISNSHYGIDLELLLLEWLLLQYVC